MLALEKEAGRRFPSWRDAIDWALFHVADSAETALVTQAFSKNSTARLIDDMEFELSPVSGRAIVEQYWISKIKGDAQGVQRFQEAVRKGVPLPPLPKGSSGTLANKE
jgi:hypothetical protein